MEIAPFLRPFGYPLFSNLSGGCLDGFGSRQFGIYIPRVVKSDTGLLCARVLMLSTYVI